MQFNRDEDENSMQRFITQTRQFERPAGIILWQFRRSSGGTKTRTSCVVWESMKDIVTSGTIAQF